jgi:hypothetical protein
MAKRKDVRDQADAALPATAESTPTPTEAASEIQAAPGETPPAEAIKIEPVTVESAPIELPRVESPNLDGSEPIAAASAETPEIPSPEVIAASAETPEIPSPEVIAATAAAPPGSSRFALLAASIAIVAAAGSFAGSLGAAGVAHFFPGSAVPPVASNNSGASHLTAELNALKANLDAATRNANAQFAKIADRIDHAQADPAAKIARMAEALDRLEKRTTVAAAATAAPETTGSIVTPSPAPGEPKLTDRVLDGWVIHQVANGHALVESRYGNLFDIAAGGFLPGVGRVEQIKRQDGRWLVVTARGVIQGYH